VTLECKCGREEFIPLHCKFRGSDATGESMTGQASSENMWKEKRIGRAFLGDM